MDKQSRGSSRGVSNFYSHTADRYFQTQYGTTDRTFINVRHGKIVEILDLLSLPKPSKALDAGCGPGVLSSDLLARGFDVTSIDLTTAMLELTRRTTMGGSRLARSSIEELPFPDASFDIVCSCGVIEYLPSYERAIIEFHRILRPGGILVLPTTSSWAPANYLAPIVERLKRSRTLQERFGVDPRPFSVSRHSPRALRRYLESLFDEIEDQYFFLLPYPRPLNRVFPFISQAIERRLDGLRHTPLRYIGEGYIAVSRKPREGRQPSPRFRASGVTGP
jgi:ubiquinone/menaquinone biosynthesis C-methylase UbiE